MSVKVDVLLADTTTAFTPPTNAKAFAFLGAIIGVGAVPHVFPNVIVAIVALAVGVDPVVSVIVPAISDPLILIVGPVPAPVPDRKSVV